MRRLGPRTGTSKAVLLWTLEWGKDYEFLRDREARGFETPALDRLPTLEADQQRLLQEFMRMSRKRPQSMGKVPQAIPSRDLIDGWELSGFNRAGMTRKEFCATMEELDAALIDFYLKRDGS